MEIDQIIKLMDAVAKNEISEISLEENGVLLTIKREKEVVQSMPMMVAAPEVPVQMPVMPQITGVSQMGNMGAMTAAPAVDVTSGQQSLELDMSGHEVKSPLVGTFYAASAPGAEPFVKVGDAVKKGQVLGIIEAMKLMNEIEAEYDGIVKSILVEDGNLVEYDQTMFIIG